MARDDNDKQGLNPALEVGTMAYYEKQHEYVTGKWERDRYEREKAEKERQAAEDDRQREIERHEREKKQLRLDIKSIWHSRISLLISIIALVIVLWDRWCPPVPNEPTSHNIEKKSERSEPTGEKQEGECDI